MPDTTVKRITNMGDPLTEIDGLGFFKYGEPREVAVTEAQARSLAGKGFLVEELGVSPAKARKE